MRETKRHCCGHILDSILCFEVIPAGQLALRGRHLILVESDLEGDDVDLEFRCTYCCELLAGGDRQWALCAYQEEQTSPLEIRSSGGTSPWPLART